MDDGGRGGRKVIVASTYSGISSRAVLTMSTATAWFMHRNFVADCDYDLRVPSCRAPLRWPNIRGAILYGSNSGGLGYRFAPESDLIEAALRDEFDTAYYPDGSVFAGIGKWPGVAILRGSWDSVEALEGALDAFRRARAPKTIFVFRGSHLLNAQHPTNMALAATRLVTFASAAVIGPHAKLRCADRVSLKSVVAKTPSYWDATNDPGR